MKFNARTDDPGYVLSRKVTTENALIEKVSILPIKELEDYRYRSRLIGWGGAVLGVASTVGDTLVQQSYRHTHHFSGNVPLTPQALYLVGMMTGGLMALAGIGRNTVLQDGPNSSIASFFPEAVRVSEQFEQSQSPAQL